MEKQEEEDEIEDKGIDSGRNSLNKK